MSNIVRRVADDLLRSEARIGLFWEALWLANGGRAVPRGSQRPAHDADLRPAAAQGDTKYRRANFDLIRTRYPSRGPSSIGYCRRIPLRPPGARIATSALPHAG